MTATVTLGMQQDCDGNEKVSRLDSILPKTNSKTKRKENTARHHTDTNMES